MLQASRHRHRVTCLLLSATVAILVIGCPPRSDLSDSSTDSFTEPPSDDWDSKELVSLLDQTLQREASGRTLTLPLHGSWQVLHGVLAYGTDFRINVDGEAVPAVDYVLRGGSLAGFDGQPGDSFGNPPRRGLRMPLDPTSKIGQGHRDQWLAILAQTGLSGNQELSLGDRTYRLSDWIHQVEYDIPMNFEAEFSWTLIALTTFHDTDHTWDARDGNRYNIESLLGSELQKNIETSPCGGTHRLIGIAMTLNKRRSEGKPINGVWQQAQQLIDDAIALAAQNQNGDGSYSASYLHRQGTTADVAEGLGTTGHVLEFLAIAAPDEIIRQPWVARAANHLIKTLDLCREVDLECGVLYHALHGLVELRDRLAESS